MFRYLFSVMALCVVSIFLFNCGGDEGNTPDENYTLSKDYAFQGEVFSFQTTVALGSGNMPAILGDESINVKAKNNQVFFIVPGSISGAQTFSLVSGNDEIRFDLTVNELEPINNVDEFLENFESDLNESLDDYKNQKDSFIKQEVYGYKEIEKDKTIWNSLIEKSQDNIALISEEQKLELAKILKANEEWMTNIDESIVGDHLAFKKTTKKECKQIIADGKEELKKGNSFTAFGKSIEAYWCAINIQKLEDATTDVEKGVMILEETDDIFMLNTLSSFIGRKIDELTQEVNKLGSTPGIAEEIEEADSEKRQSELVFSDGEPNNVSATILFRTVSQNDGTAEGELADFVKIFDQLIVSYDNLVKAMDEPLIWRPGYANKTKSLAFNRYLSIEKSTISNSDISLVNTQYNNDLWEVIFGNDGSEESPAFTFNLIYNDGHVEVSKEIKAKIGEAGGLATVNTFDVKEVTGTTAKAGGILDNHGGLPIQEVGICYGTEYDPTISNTKIAGTLESDNTFWVDLSGLQETTQYYARAYVVNAKGVSYGSSDGFITLPDLEIGQSYLGGKLAYIFKNGDPGYDPFEAHGLVVASSDQSTDAPWGCEGISVEGTEIAIGTGASNTDAILKACTETGTAAKLCRALGAEWYLPSRGELDVIKTNLDKIGGFSEEKMAVYWTSTQFSSSQAYGNFINLSNSNYLYKESNYFVRAVRSF